jgi:hypothetical protein
MSLHGTGQGRRGHQHRFSRWLIANADGYKLPNRLPPRIECGRPEAGFDQLIQTIVRVSPCQLSISALVIECNHERAQRRPTHDSGAFVLFATVRAGQTGSTPIRFAALCWTSQ